MNLIKKFFSKDLNKAFISAFEQGFYKKALHYAQKGANPNAKNEEGNTFLHCYVLTYTYLSVQEFKKWNLSPEPGEELLAEMKKLGTLFDCQNNLQETPLEIAIQKDNPLLISMLLRAGADKEHRNKNGLTPLQNAIYNGRGRSLRILLRMGADIEAELKKADSLMDLFEKGKEVITQDQYTDYVRVASILNELKERGVNVDKAPRFETVKSLAIIEAVPTIQVVHKLQNQNTHS